MLQIDAIEQYYKLIEQIDKISENLIASHQPHIKCVAGCYGCCTNLSVFPLEFYAIKQKIDENKLILTKNNLENCFFLQNKLCQIYPFRPLICRSHGLPIVYAPDETKPQELSVSFCQLNFNEIDYENYIFDDSNTLNIDAVNIALFELNRLFIEQNQQLNLNFDSRINLENLIE